MSSHRVVTAGLVLGAAAIGVVAGAWLLPLVGQAKMSHGENLAPEICMLSRDDVLTRSKVGKAATSRMQRITQQARNQIEDERNAIVKRFDEFTEKSESPTKQALDNRKKRLNQELQGLRQKAERIDARIRYTRTVVTQRINDVIAPLVSDSYKDRACSVLIRRESVLKGNETNDLTSDVTVALDDTVTKTNFDLLALPERASDKGRNDSGKDSNTRPKDRAPSAK